jgi:Na+:H+ antiporter, NhaA family
MQHCNNVLYLRWQNTGGVLLLAATALALAWANSPFAASHHSLFQGPHAPLGAPLISEGLMAFFFLLAGLEIKREMATGELATRPRAALPLIAAAGGMLAPALVYLAVTALVPGGGPFSHGWGIPTATDIAFAAGALSLLRGKVPSALPVLLVALAIADDLGSIVLVVFFYSSPTRLLPLAGAALCLLALAAANRAGVLRLLPYLLGGAVLWLLLSRSGVHPAIAGALTAAFVPAPLLERLERVLNLPVALVVLPLYALANAGVSFAGLGGTMSHPVALGVLLALLLGKPAGIALATWAALKMRVAALPAGVGMRHILGMGMLGGIGFTMSLFVAELSFPGHPEALALARTGILAGSCLSACAGLAWLGWKGR